MSGRRSAKRGKTDIASTSHGHDQQWFISQEAKDYYNGRLLDKAVLTIVADNWLRFISGRLLPTKHTFEVTRERAVMSFAILTDVPFDIGHFLHKSIWKSAMGGLTVGLYHPSLIIALCARAGLERQPRDELLPPNKIIRPCQKQPPAPGLEEWVDRLADEVHQLQLQQEQQFAYQQQWWTLWADQMHIPMSSHPHYPSDEPADPPRADMGDE
ncbi:hypothetical protein CDL12_10766 [Handroanthus impetiginosus]|uniref:Putative plant transposon protein domain-containing protein n=1 Tax=Handroanthus impetiginosus TaxID=429701 RepID=A0A2G9HGB8_9LAMI|nr:hypothetical protein CDL12_10766 [Handroanthus impetiginosus]